MTPRQPLPACRAGRVNQRAGPLRRGEAAAYRVLNRFEVFRLAVSLGGTESLVEHPMSMTHADVPPETLESYGVRPGLIRMSVGLEHSSDLVFDLEQALEQA